MRDLGQQLANERGKLTPEQIRTREKELQDRITESRRVFGERNRIIQEASQYVMAQIDRAVEMVTQQVAISRGINIVLNRAQILGTTSDFDLTPAVVDDLNKVLASVVIPPDGVSPVAMQQPGRRRAGAARSRRRAGSSHRPPAAGEAAGHAATAPADRAGRRQMDWPPIAGDPRFFRRSGPHSLAAVADAAQADAPPRRLMLTGVAPLQTAEPGEVSFLDNRKYVIALAETRAGAVIVHRRHGGAGPGGRGRHRGGRALRRLGAGRGAVPSAAAFAAGRASIRRRRSRGHGRCQRRGRAACGDRRRCRDRAALPHRPRPPSSARASCWAPTAGSARMPR